MDRSAFYTFVGDLVSDPNHDRYTTAMIDTALDHVQNHWNIQAEIIKDTVTLTVVAGTREYLLSALTGTPIKFLRVTHRGLPLEKRDKAYFDLYHSDDWTDDTGTPIEYYVDMETSTPKLVLYPVPQSGDAGAYLVVEYVKRHTTMASASDQPFNSLSLTEPYHYGIGYEAASLLLNQDPTEINLPKAARYWKVGGDVLSDVEEVFGAFRKQEPMRLSGGRYWRS